MPARELVTASQFALPSRPAWYVRRQRLLDMLDSSAGKPLVLVSAPAGSGKTALVADWVHSRQRAQATVWVTAQQPDEAVAPLVLQALSRMGAGTSAPPGRRGAQEQPAVAAVAETLAAGPGHLTLVLDGFELASTAAADELQSLIDLSGERLQVVVLSRVDPVLPLYRYRLSDTIGELRTADLAFTPTEAQELFALSGVALTDEEARELLARTGGWAAALRFAVRMVDRAGNCYSALACMEAATADIYEFLLGEVLETQAPEVREFLLRTSVSDVLYPELVEELVGRMPVRALEDLTKLNTFVEPTDQGRRCFRYQPLFRDLLRAQLAYERPEEISDLQRRTGSWFVRQGLVKTGLPYLTACRAWDLAAAAVVDSRAFVELLLDGEEGQYVPLLRDIPTDMYQPSACAVRAALAWVCGDEDGCARELERLHATGHVHGSSSLGAVAALLEALRGRDGEPPDKAVLLAERAGERVAALEARSADVPSDLGAFVSNAEGVAHFRAGNIAEARHAFNWSISRDGEVHPYLRSEALGYLALADAVVGRLTQAERNAGRSLALADVLPAWAERPPSAELALGYVALEHYDLDLAAEHLARLAACRQAQRDPLCRALRIAATAGLLRGRGQLSTALSKTRVGLLELAWHDKWLADRLRLEAARLLVASGESDRALQELTEVTEQPDAKVVAALAYLAEGDESAASDCLAGVNARSAPLGVVVTRLLADGACLAGQRSPNAARQAVGRGLRLASRERMRRPLREAPAAVRRMLTHDPQLVEAGRWVLHDSGPVALHTRQGAVAPDRTRAASSRVAHAAAAPVVERLTAKELEVLGHLANLLSTEEIAAEMFVSVNTVRTHVRSILRKLGVSRRNAAVRRAREIGLLGA